MSVRNPANAAGPAASMKKHRCAARADFRYASATIAERQLEHGARALAAVINASTKLQQLRNRALALESALARMKARQAGFAA